MHKIFPIVPVLTVLLPVLSPVLAVCAEVRPSQKLAPNVDAIAQNTVLTTVEPSIALPANFQYPNGIAHASDGTLYVGSITSGQILRITPDGKIETFFSGNDEVFAATALRLDESRSILWGSSPDFLGTGNSRGENVRRRPRVFALDTRSGEVLRVILMPKGGFGNDIALDPQGGIYITDSTLARIHYLAPRTTQLQTWAVDERFRAEGIGLAGIARRSDGVLVVGHYSNGELFKVTPQPQSRPRVETIPLERRLENPDGMQFAPDGSLILTEGAGESGNGRLLRINVFAPTHLKPIKTLATDLKSPVNLTLAGRQVWVTESQIRHRLIPEQSSTVPDRFFVHRFILP
ncbi:SMP-30/Gluconolaconase/LRE domain protein [Rippkaea orientalis PCC 8801]|uniref:SMP-30/Gluconolaconase/LRE domain protein n=1 Tax=Rippkaea orientalis (strain PCC 8801 / RF-1) TaxID=41431 RepID=B7K588_RIPO1|nr:gluconolaconase [Rippkaea orientalis]ACK67914.1 SMP-30/Gluconolaconase/LRE domain protein [Rippkaea orientalis PCC 8801]